MGAKHDCAVKCKYELNLKKMSVKEIYYLLIKIEYLWKFPSSFYLKCINSEKIIL